MITPRDGYHRCTRSVDEEEEKGEISDWRAGVEGKMGVQRGFTRWQLVREVGKMTVWRREGVSPQSDEAG